MEWLRKKIVKWLRTPEHVDYYYISECFFVRESPEDEPYIKKIGKIIKNHTDKNAQS